MLLNRVRSLGHADVRRKHRNLASAEWATPPATPEDAVLRLDLQRRLAALMNELPDPFRRVV